MNAHQSKGTKPAYTFMCDKSSSGPRVATMHYRCCNLLLLSSKIIHSSMHTCINGNSRNVLFAFLIMIVQIIFNIAYIFPILVMNLVVVIINCT